MRTEPRADFVDGSTLRSCLARFATGVTVAATDGPAGRVGLTVNSFTAVSLDPPLVLVSISKRARCHDSFLGRPFAVSVLGAEQERTALHFAGKPQTKPVLWDPAARGACLVGALATLECGPWAAHDGGDHTLIVGEVWAARYRDGDGLGYFCGHFVEVKAAALGIEFIF